MKLSLFLKNNIITLLFFALAGAIWGGWDLYASDPPATYPLTAVGGLSLAILGGLGLSLQSRNPKFILRVLGLGLTGVVIGFFLAGIGVYNLSIFGGQIIALFPIPADAAGLFGIGKTPISIYWLNFVLAGSFIGLFFAFALKAKILPMVWRSAVGFGLAAIIGPILGNLIGGLFNSVFLSYLITFVFISKILGLMILWGARKLNNAGPHP